MPCAFVLYHSLVAGLRCLVHPAHVGTVGDAEIFPLFPPSAISSVEWQNYT